MECTTASVESLAKSQIRSFVAVSGEPEQAELLDALSADEHDYGVIFVDTIARSYSRIKQVMPDVVIVYCSIDDIDGCQLLSMLELDPDLSCVRVVTCATAPARPEVADFVADVLETPTELGVSLSMN